MPFTSATHTALASSNKNSVWSCSKTTFCKIWVEYCAPVQWPQSWLPIRHHVSTCVTTSSTPSAAHTTLCHGVPPVHAMTPHSRPYIVLNSVSLLRSYSTIPDIALDSVSLLHSYSTIPDIALDSVLLSGTTCLPPNYLVSEQTQPYGVDPSGLGLASAQP